MAPTGVSDQQDSSESDTEMQLDNRNINTTKGCNNRGEFFSLNMFFILFLNQWVDTWVLAFLHDFESLLRNCRSTALTTIPRASESQGRVWYLVVKLIKLRKHRVWLILLRIKMASVELRKSYSLCWGCFKRRVYQDKIMISTKVAGLNAVDNGDRLAVECSCNFVEIGLPKWGNMARNLRAVGIPDFLC